MSFLAYVALGAGMVALAVGMFKLYRAYTMWRNEPVPAKEARIQDGIVEVEGEAYPVEDGSLFEAKYTGDEVIAHSWSRKERDLGAGNDNWSTEESGEDAVPFYIEDDTGRIAVNPEDATLDIEGETVNRTPALKKQVGKLQPGDEVHVFGQRKDVVERREELGSVNVYIGDGDDAPTFRITDGDEEEVVRRIVRKGGGVALIGGFFAFIGAHMVLF